MRLAIAFSLLLLAKVPAQGKCAVALYAVEGKLSLPPGVAPDDVRIYLFLEGTERASQYPGRDFAVPDANGSFRVEVRLSTLSKYSRARGERCDRIEAEGDLFIVGKGLYGHRSQVEFDTPKSEALRDLRVSTSLDLIRLEAMEEVETSPDQLGA